MTAKPASELLYDSEAALRLVDSAIKDLGELAGEPDQSSGGLLTLSELLTRAHEEIPRVLASLRQTRAVFERAAVDKLKRTHDKLREVSNATESAATDILDGLERAIAHVNELDTLSSRDGGARSTAVRAALREELFALVGHLQFEDITAQQLEHASLMLTETEERLSHLLQAFDPALQEKRTPTPTSVHASAPIDPNATHDNRAQRQAVVDEIFTKRRSGS
jgi:chemotaxis regulatin CheY-phosphate phosphatase CheZ